MALTGCKSHKTLTSESSTIHTDTSKVLVDSAVAKKDSAVTRLQTTRDTSCISVEFIDSGGVLAIGSMGVIHAKGVKSFKGLWNKSSCTLENVSVKSDSASVHAVKENGVHDKDTIAKAEKHTDWQLRIALILAAVLVLFSIYSYLHGRNK